MERPAVRLSFFVAIWLVFLTGLLGWTHANQQNKVNAAGMSGLTRGQKTVEEEASPPVRTNLATRSANRSRLPAPAPQPARPVPAATATTTRPGPTSSRPAASEETKSSHVVLQGETLHDIAGLYGISVTAVRTANGLTSDLIRTGQRLLIPGANPMRQHQVESGDTLWEIAAKYEVEIQALTQANKGTDPGHLQIGQILRIPPSIGMALSGRLLRIAELQGEFAWPVLAPVSSPFGSRWGRNHAGIDLAANQGDDIRAAREGRVILAGVVSGYGNTVVLQHSDGSRTLYAHCSVLKVKPGQSVAKGQVIAQVGSTGISTGPHLHFEIIVNDRPTDPLLYLPKREGR